MIEGIFADNFCVEGVKTFRNGTVFNGTFRGQNKYSTGKLTFENQENFEGEFREESTLLGGVLQ